MNIESKEKTLQRLSEIELERASLLGKIGQLQNNVALLDKEYVALKNILSMLRSDGRWASQSTSMLETIYYMLKDAGKPLHYMEIHRRLQNELFHIAGSASISNLVVRLNRDERFTKVRRGIYGLAEWESDELNPLSKEHNIRSVTKYDEKGQKAVLFVAKEIDIERIKFNLESTEIDIQVTQNNIKTLRDRLLGHNSEFSFPESVDPANAIPVLERKLIKLLEQRDALRNKLQGLENNYITSGGDADLSAISNTASRRE